MNKLIHTSIVTNKCHCLNANEAIIVYKKTTNNGYVRRVEAGPTIYMIQPDEWLHKFSWHANSDENKTSYTADKHKFEVLNFAPNQLYYNVNQVRTADDALIKIKLMIFYELKHIEQMVSFNLKQNLKTFENIKYSYIY